MATKAIRGRSKSTGQLTYFLSSEDTVIVGTGENKRTLYDKLEEVDESLAGKMEYFEAWEEFHSGGSLPYGKIYVDGGLHPYQHFVGDVGGFYIYLILKDVNATAPHDDIFYVFRRPEGSSPSVDWSYVGQGDWEWLDGEQSPSGLLQYIVDSGLAHAEAIEKKIPAEAGSSNKLADKEWVNTQIGNNVVDASHIADGAVTTAKIANANVTKAKLAQDVLDFLEEYLADFKNTVESTAALKALTGNKNDWAVYKHTDANNNVIYSRYRYDENYNDATTGHWKFELDINSSSFTAAQWAAINSGINTTWVGGVDGNIAAFDEEINGEGGIMESLEETIKNLTIVTAGKDGIPYGVLPDDDNALRLKQFYADNWTRCPLQFRQSFVGDEYYYVFVGTVHNLPGYVIFKESDRSFIGLGTLSSPIAAHTSILYAAYPEFASCADLGGYELDEVDVEDDIL